MDVFLQINDTRRRLDEIDRFEPSSAFEENTIRFIRQWLSGTQSFEIQTSGSTGTPKVIHISRQQMEASARLTIGALALQPGQVALVCLDTGYIAGKMMLARALMNNMHIVAVTPSSTPLTMPGLQPDFAAMVPLQVEECLKDEQARNILEKMTAVIIGGAPVSSALEAAISSLTVPVYATYGMTETVSHIALRRLNGPEKSIYFQAFDEVSISTDERGCLVINSAATAHKDITTNDRVVLHGSHQFEWLGRADNIINSGGIKVQSEKVERAVELIFHQQNIGNRFFIAGLPDRKLGQQVTLVIEASAPLAQEDKILKHLAESLDKYHAPRKVIYVSKFTETATGKINRGKTLQQ